MRTSLLFLAFSLLGICQAQIFTNDWTYTTTLPAKDSNWSSGVGLRYSPSGECAYSFRYANVAGKLASGVTWIGADGTVKWEVRGTALDYYGRSGQSYSLVGMYNNTLIYRDSFAYPDAANTSSTYAIRLTEDGVIKQEITNLESPLYLSIPPFAYGNGYFSYHYNEAGYSLTVKRFSLTPPEQVQLAAAPAGVDDGNLIINWDTQVGMRYQVQEANDLAGTWLNLGSPITGTGAAMSYSKPTTESKTYLRVLITP